MNQTDGHAVLAMTAHTLSANDASGREMAEWKQLVATAVQSGAPLQLRYFGGANQITGYRLFYMLQFAKRAGVGNLSFVSDGVFWIDEATEWLIESGVDAVRLVLPGGSPSPALAERMRAIAEAGAGRPAISVVSNN